MFRNLIVIIFLFALKNLTVGQNLLYKNEDLSFEERVEILINQMTIEEKISQLMDVSPAIPRLDIPAYNWWNEGLHGVARAGLATVFPQAIGLAATFNDSLIFKVATAISDEFRAKYNEAIKQNNRSRYFGLTVWSPNINIFRDPRWGRGQETYGEDPYLTSIMGIAFVKGLQGDHPKYLKTIATPKHYVVHSGPEKLRHEFDVNVSNYDFFDTYTPAFEATVKVANAYSIMSAYNRFRGKSCSASDSLLNILLRNQWGFKGYVVSDCDAVGDIYQTHKIVSTPEEAAALALKNGCDLNCGNTYQFLKQAYDKGLITEKDIDIALKRLLLARFKLGMFDQAEKNPYNSIPFSVVDNPNHRKLALEAARQSLVLLKNDKKTLPINKKLIKSIAVVGPNANMAEVMFGNYNGTPSYAITPLMGISKNVFQKTSVFYHPLNGLVTAEPAFEPIPAKYFEFDGKTGIKTEIYDNLNLEGQPILVQIDTTINFEWYAQSPFKNIPANNISIRWTGKLKVPTSGKYTLAFTGDDGYRVWIDNKLVADYWRTQAAYTSSFEINLEKDKSYAFKIEYFQSRGNAVAKFRWNAYTQKDIDEAIEKASKCDVIVYVGGLSPEIEGEEMNVTLPGFDRGDRTNIELPDIQTQMLKRLKKSGKPVIFVVMAGSAIAMNWESKNLDAILYAWYPGQEGGNAIADVLFGNYNPSGRLPVTFYASTSQLPPFTDYSMKNRTYRYFKGEALYPFGFGLSYTQFTYSELKIPETSDTREKIKVKVRVTNSGGREGEEVVQLYVKHPTATVPVPIHALKGFKKVRLKAGDYTYVEFTLDSKDIAILDEKNRWVVVPGDIDIFVGGQQPTNTLIKEKKVLMGTTTKTGNNFYLTDK